MELNKCSVTGEGIKKIRDETKISSIIGHIIVNICFTFSYKRRKTHLKAIAYMYFELKIFIFKF